MSSLLHQVLRNLCFNTGWKYAIFWKLKLQAPMILTWDDAYYDKHGQCDLSDSKRFDDVPDNSYSGHFAHDTLELAVAKMSYHVYALGEGIVGQVALSGKHLWISANKHATESCSLLEYSNGLRTQFSAGIKTIAVVAVVPYGVVQLGSLNDIAEDLKLVNHIRKIFFELQDLLAGHISTIDSSSCLTNLSTRSSASQNYHDYIRNEDKSLKDQEPDKLYPVLRSLDKPVVHNSHDVPLPEVYPWKRVVMSNGPSEYSPLGSGQNTDLLQPASMNTQKQVCGKLAIDKECKGETSGMRDVGVGSEADDTQSSVSFYNDKHNLYSLCLPSVFDGRIQTDAHKTCLNFSSGCELYEALGPSFKKQNSNRQSESQKAEKETAVLVSDEGTSGNNLLNVNLDMEHLLEAVVANVCPSVSKFNCENPASQSVKSLLTAENGLEPSASDTHTIGSSGYSYDQSYCLASSETCGVRPSKGLSSASSSRCSEQLEGPREQAKISKKRARPGESCRPRPRDRQLIQDRIKELRELVPNGSKCSIDSLLERTIKHMLFMQCTTKHADKLDKYAESRLFDKKSSVQGSSSLGQGSSWAVEVENNSRVFPIMVEDINMSGQMLVKVLCDDCCQFFEIAAAIKSLDLTILKGVTEAYGEKVLMFFVVEGENNRNIQRVDILWSLVQILQPKTEV